MKKYIVLFITILHASTGSIIGDIIDADTHHPSHKTFEYSGEAEQVRYFQKY